MAGFAVAAASASDRGAERALPGLGPNAKPIAARARALAALGTGDREAALAECVAEGHVPPPLDHEIQDPLTARALALIAGQLPAEQGRIALRAGPMPRPGFVPDPELLQLLCKVWNGVQPWHD